jgi:uncharacterized membrane protein
MVLAVTSLTLTDQRAALIGIQLRMAFIVTAFSMLPLLLVQYGLSGQVLWMAASAGYLAGVVANLIWSSVNQTSISRLPPNARVLAATTGVSAMALLLFNLWQAVPWPYLTQLCIGWSCSTLLFLGFIHEVLIDPTRPGDST